MPVLYYNKKLKRKKQHKIVVHIDIVDNSPDTSITDTTLSNAQNKFSSLKFDLSCTNINLYTKNGTV